MRRRDFIALAGAAAAFPRVALAQQTKRLGFLGTLNENDPTLNEYLNPFRASLAAQGWVEGKNLRVDYRWGNNVVEVAAKQAKELVELKPDVILASTAPVALEVKNLTSTIPIIFTLAGQPVETGLVDSLARPSGNLTGFTNNDYSFAGNALGMLIALAPKMRRAATILDPTVPATYPIQETVWLEATKKADVESLILSAGTVDEIRAAMREIGSQPATGFHPGVSAFYVVNRGVILSEVMRLGLPAVYSNINYAPDGGLVSYGVDVFDVFGRSGDYVGRVLNGERVRDLPVQQPTKYTLIVNLKAARAQGWTIPDSILVRADRVIE